MATATAAAAAAAIPAEVETEALTLLHRCRGDRAESDLVGRIERLSRRIETIAGLYRDGSRTLRRFIAEVYPQIRGRRAAEERLHRLRKLAEPKAPRRGPTAPPSEELRRLAVEARGERAIADIGP